MIHGGQASIRILSIGPRVYYPRRHHYSIIALQVVSFTMATEVANTEEGSNLLPRREVVYCGKCGMPPEYCEYGPDFETHCEPWLLRHHPELHAQLATTRTATGTIKKKAVPVEAAVAKVRPAAPWTMEERLTAMYKEYMPEKLDAIPSLLEKYAGKEEKLFEALIKKYGPEPYDPYYGDSDSEDDDDDDDEEEEEMAGGDKKKNKRRGISAKKETGGTSMRVVVQKVSQKKKRHMTIITGMETVPGAKLKDVSKAFSKKFAGSSSVKDTAKGDKEIIIQGDHLYDVAEMIVDTYGVPESCVFLDIDGDIVPLR
jgi:density-regulated protein DRP1